MYKTSVIFNINQNSSKIAKTVEIQVLGEHESQDSQTHIN